MASSFELPQQAAELLGHQTAEAGIDAASGYCWALHKAEVLLWRFQDGAPAASQPPMHLPVVYISDAQACSDHQARGFMLCRRQGACVQPGPGIRFGRAPSRCNNKSRGAS